MSNLMTVGKVNVSPSDKLTVDGHFNEMVPAEEVQEAKLQGLKDLERGITDLFEQGHEDLAELITELAQNRIIQRSTIGQNVGFETNKLNEETLQHGVRLALRGVSRSAIAASIGISVATHSKWLKSGQEFLEKFSANPQLRITRHQLLTMQYYEAIIVAESCNEQDLLKMVHHAAKEDWRAATWLLARRYPKEWGSGREKMDIQISGEVEVKHSGVLAVAEVSNNIEDWQASKANIIDVDPAKLPNMTPENEDEDEDG